MDEKTKSRVKTSLFTLIGLATMGVLIWYVGPGRLLASLLSVSIPWLCLSVAISLIYYYLRAFRWTLLLKPVKNGVVVSNAFWITMIGYMANSLSGTRVGGEFLRAFLMKLREGIGFFEAFSSICVERILDLLGIVTIGVVSLSFFSADIVLPQWFIDSFRLVGAFVLAAITGLIIATRKEEALSDFLMRVLALIRLPENWREKFMYFFKTLIVGARGISTDLGSVFVILVFTVAAWLLQAISVYALFVAFGFDLSLGLALLGSMILQITFILPSPPGQAGTYEGAFVGIFVALGLPLEEILPMSLLNHFVYFSLIVLFGWIGMGKMNISFRELKNLGKQ